MFSSLLEKSSDKEFINSKITLISYIASNENGHRLVYDYLEENWESLYKEYGSALSSLITAAANSLTTKNDLRRVQSFAASQANSGATRDAFNSAIDAISTNVRWLETNLNPVQKWLEQRSKF